MPPSARPFALFLILFNVWACAGSRDTPAQRAELVGAMETDPGALFTFLEQNGVQLRDRGYLAQTSQRVLVSNAERIYFGDVLNQNEAVYLYAYADGEAAQVDARRLDFGGTLRTEARRRGGVEALVPPTTSFPVFRSGRYLIVHAGQDQTITELLTRMFGRPVRG